jgi:type I restriction enzyme, S subunit
MTPHTTSTLSMQAKSFPTYPNMKHSGVEWIGEIPEHWEVRKMVHTYDLIGSGTTPTSGSEKYYADGTENWLQTGDLTDGAIEHTSRKITKSAVRSFTSLKMFSKDAVVIAMYGATIGKLGFLNIDTYTNQACCVIDKSSIGIGKFLFYWLMASKENIIAMSYGGGQPNISQELVRSLRFPLPPLPEQTAIANFLDTKLALIDKAIAQKQRMIELLQERKQILIKQAVTRGLDPNVKLKDSGVEWIGMVPEGWDVVKMKFLYQLKSGGTPSKDRKDFWDGNIFWASPKDIKHPRLSCTEDKVTEKALSTTSLSLVKAGSIIMVVRSGILQRTIPMSIIEVEMTINQDVKAFVPITDSQFSAQFFQYFVIGMESLLLNLWVKQGATVESIEVPDMVNTVVLKPPTSVQNEIVAKLDAFAHRMEKVVSQHLKAIETLKAYKTTLINSAVMGKIRVI